MSTTTIMVIGAPGTGKSSSIRNLDPKTTFIINVLDKPLPFRGYKARYKPIKGWDDKEGNYYATDDWRKIVGCIRMVSQARPEIKTLVLDDAQYIMANEFMKRATETGFTKFTEIGLHMWSVITELQKCRDDLTGVVLTHSELDVNGKAKAKTIGKMLDEKITLEGMFSYIFHSIVADGEHKFLTAHDGVHTARGAIGLFDEACIDNDLEKAIKRVLEYAMLDDNPVEAE